MRKHLTIILAITVLIAAGCAKKEAPKPKEIKNEEDALAGAGDAVRQKVLSFDLEGLGDNGAKKWDVKGESAEAVSESQIKLDNIVANAYGEEAKATITAEKGTYDRAKNSVRLEQNVRATIEGTASFAGEFVGLPAGPAAKAKPQGGAKAKKTRTVITCDGEVEFDYERNQAYFNKNVKAVNDDGTIEADKITVNLDTKTKRVNEIIAEGNVKIARGENTTYSEKAIYIESEKRIILTGQPRLIIYQEGSPGAEFSGGTDRHG